MPKVKISEYSATANSNTDVASINIDEGCAPSGINNAIRAIMGHLKDFQSGTSNDPFTVGSTGSLTLSYGTANGVAYLNGSKVLTTGSALVFDGTTFQSTGAANFATTSGNIGLGVAVPTQDIEASGTFRVQASATGGTGVGIETFAAGATAYFTSYNRTTSAYAPLALTGSTLSITGTTTVSGDSILSGTVKGASTISVGNATPSTSGAGITFPATQSASSDANTLDDYEEGTWTPGASFGGGTTGITYHADNGGRYTRVGSLVTLTGYLRLSNKGSSTGTARITGLPFMPTGTGETGNFANAMGYTVAITYSGTLAFYGSAGATNMFAISNSSGATSTVLTDTAFANTSQTVISLSYLAT